MSDAKEGTGKAGRKARDFQKFTEEQLRAALASPDLESVEEQYTLARAVKDASGTVTTPEVVVTARTIPLPKRGGGAASLNAWLKSFRDVEGFDAIEYVIGSIHQTTSADNTSALKRPKNPMKPEEISYKVPTLRNARSVDPIKVLASKISGAKSKRAAGEMSEAELQAMRDEVLRAAGLL